MTMLQALSFTTPLALGALILLPLIWWLLRFTPPRPETVRFPPLRLLLDLVNREEQPDKTPWWLLLLRLAVAALVIFGVSHPLYAPGHVDALTRAPLLLVVDDTWAAARDWDKRRTIINEILDGARAANATVTLAVTTPQARPQRLEPAAADDVRTRTAVLEPRALDPDRPGTLAQLQKAFGSTSALHVIWLSDGIDDGKAAQFADGLKGLAGGAASIEAVVPDRSGLPMALAAPSFDSGKVKIGALRVAGGAEHTAKIVARASNGRALAEATVNFAADAAKADAVIDLPVELRNDIRKIEIDGERNAAATFLMDDRWRRKAVALQSGTSSEADQPLLSPFYYVSRALEPYAELSEPVVSPAIRPAVGGDTAHASQADAE